eukprot:3405802-Prorocentrum_lima.AAC.1
MTSSLVGSEMCIRDSNRASPRTQSLWSKTEAEMSCTKPIPCEEACWKCPVSYTHLTLPTICSV